MREGSERSIPSKPTSHFAFSLVCAILAGGGALLILDARPLGWAILTLFGVAALAYLGRRPPEMKRVLRTLAIALALLGLLAVGAFLLIESGEIIVLHTTDDQGGQFRTRLAVYDYRGAPWLRGAYSSGWVSRLRANPRTELVRGDRAECRQAVFRDDPELPREIARIGSEKYRIPYYGSWFLKFIGGTRIPSGETVFIRLEPCATNP